MYILNLIVCFLVYRFTNSVSQLALYSVKRPLLGFSTPLSRPQSNHRSMVKYISSKICYYAFGNFPSVPIMLPLHASHYACIMLHMYEQPRCKIFIA